MARRRAPVSTPVVLTIAGSDSGGGAGIQADLKTIEANGGFGTSVVTAVTSQNTQGVTGSHVLPTEEIESQYDAVVDDFDVQAVKTGMLATADVIETVTDRLAAYDGPLVVDPVMVAASGDRLLAPEAEDAYEDLIREATLVTPNVDEAEVLTGMDIADSEDAREAGEAIVDLGADAALVKGGHLDGGTDVADSADTGPDRVADILVVDAAEDGPLFEGFDHPRIDTDATHGSGCTLSSAIATDLAQGSDLTDAVHDATAFMERAIRYSHDVGDGPGAVHHMVGLRERAARSETMETVNDVVERFVDRDVSALVPEVGMNVVGATPYAEAVEETAAVEGRITRTFSGVAPNRGVRLGASSHVARFLLSAREFEPDYRFAVNCRFDEDVEDALTALDGPVTEYDRSAEPESLKEKEGSTMGWGARQAFESVDGTPIAVIDRGEVGKEEIVKLLAEDPETLAERVFAVLDAVEAGR